MDQTDKPPVSKAAMGFVHACMTAPPSGDVPRSMALMFDTHTAGIRRERDELAAMVRVLRDTLQPFADASAASKAFPWVRGWTMTIPDLRQAESAFTSAGSAVLAELRARLFEEAASLVQGILDDPKERASCALAVMTLQGCAMSERAKVGQQAQEGAAEA